MPHYDTGAWSLYDQFSESNLNYHELLTEFLQHLCERTRKGPPMSTAPPPTPTTPTATTPTTTTPTTTTPTTPSGGTAPGTGTTASAARRDAALRRRRPHDAARDADRGRSDLLHDGPEIHDLREDAAA